MALPIVESTPATPGSNTSVAEHKVPRFGALAAEAKARFGDNPTVAPAGAPAATGTIPPPTVPASPPAVIPDPAQSVQPRTSPSSREYLTPSQAADPGQPLPAASGQPQAQMVQGADPAKTPEQQILDIPDDAYVRVTVNGEPQLLKGKEAKAQMMRAADYTRKTQELATHRRAIQPFVEASQGDPRRAQELLQSANEAPQLRTILSDPDMLERYLRATNHPLLSRLQQQPGQQPAQQPAQRPNPDELASLGEVEKIAGDRFATVDQKVAAAMERIQQVEDGVVTAIEKKLQFLDNATEAKRIKGQLSGVIADTIKENPVLKVIPNLQRDVLQEVRAMGPRNEAEVLQATAIVLQAFVENAQSTYENLYAKQALERKQVLTQGIEPPTGTTVSIQPPTSFVDPKTGKFSFDNMRRAARGYNRT